MKKTKPTIVRPELIPRVKDGYPGEGIGKLISKGIEVVTGKKLPTLDPVLGPAGSPVPFLAH